MADVQEKKAAEMMAQADKKTKSGGGFLGGLFGGAGKLEEAAELYVRAANCYKMAKKWGAAGHAFCRAAEVHQRLSSNHEAATNYVDAGNCYKKADPNEAIRCLQTAIEIFTDMGRFTIAAKHHISIAEIYESEMADVNQAITNYEQAADYYKGEESNSSANKCLVKVAQYAAQLEQYEKAIDIYEQIAASSQDNTLLKYSVKDYFFRAALCRMCLDVDDAEITLQKYVDQFPAFDGTREQKLLLKLMETFKEEDVEAFQETVKNYDEISRLDQWLTTMLLRVKRKIEKGDDDLK